MKSKHKKILGFLGVLVTLGVLTSCNSFCTTKDSAGYRYLVDPISTEFFETEDQAVSYVKKSLTQANDVTIYLDNAFTTELTDDAIKNYKVKVLENGSLVEKSLIEKADFGTSKTSELLAKASVTDIYYIRTTTLSAYTSKDVEGEKVVDKTFTSTFSKNSFIRNVEKSALSSSIIKPVNQFYNEFDKKILEYIAENAIADGFYEGKTTRSAYELLFGYSYEEYTSYKNGENKNSENYNALVKGGTYTTKDGTTSTVFGRNNSVLARFGKYKFLEENTKDDIYVGNGNYWKTIETINAQIKNDAINTHGIGTGYVMSYDFLNVYKNQLNQQVNTFKACFTLDEDYYGHVGEDEINDTYIMTSKSSWKEAWRRGWLEGLLVYPIASLVEIFSHNFGMNGWGQILSVLLVTVIVRLFFMLITLRSSISQQRMQYLSPEIEKLQQKYPNSNTNTYEKQKLSQAQMALYKKHHINPLSSLLVLVIQFPLFIAVWNGMSGSASLTLDSVLGLRLSDTIFSVLKNFNNWPRVGGWWTALVLILLMSAGQIVAMKLPQWLNKKRNSEVAKTRKSPAQNDSQKTTKIISWVMTGFVIFMGFTLPAAMGVYWLAGSLFSIAQTFILTAIMRKGEKKRK